MEKAKILIIDDNILFVEKLKKHIKKFNEPVEVLGIVREGNKAIRVIERIGIDNINLILLDNILPGMEGTEILSILKDKYKYKYQTKIFFLTGFLTPQLITILSLYGLKVPPMQKNQRENIFEKITERIKLYADFSHVETRISKIEVTHYVENLEWSLSGKAKSFLICTILMSLENKEDLKTIIGKVAKSCGSTYFYVDKVLRNKIRKFASMTVKDFINKTIMEINKNQ